MCRHLSRALIIALKYFHISKGENDKMLLHCEMSVTPLWYSLAASDLTVRLSVGFYLHYYLLDGVIQLQARLLTFTEIISFSAFSNSAQLNPNLFHFNERTRRQRFMKIFWDFKHQFISCHYKVKFELTRSWLHPQLSWWYNTRHLPTNPP